MAWISSLLLLLAGACMAPMAAGCGANDWYDVYGGERCEEHGDAWDIKCQDKWSGAACGARLMKQNNWGVGEVCMNIKAAPGNGVVTSFYVSNNGGMYDDNGGSWNEVDFEIMGMQGKPGGSKVWTNFFTGSKIEHHRFVSVPFDVTADAHAFCIRMNMSHVEWVADGSVIRSDDYTSFPDMVAAVTGNTWQSFVSVWGKTYSDGDLGCKEFVDGMGKLDDNPNGFPLTASFQPVKGTSVLPQINAFEIGPVADAHRLGARAAGALLATAAMAAFVSVAGAVIRRSHRSAEQEEQREPLTLAHAQTDQEFDSI